MSVQEIKDQLATLSRREQDEVIAFLFHHRHSGDAQFQDRLARRMSDVDPSHWLSPDEFERALGKKENP